MESHLARAVVGPVLIIVELLTGTVRKLEARGTAYDLRKLPAYSTWQLFFHDPNGAKVEVDFDPSEAAPA